MPNVHRTYIIRTSWRIKNNVNVNDSERTKHSLPCLGRNARPIESFSDLIVPKFLLLDTLAERFSKFANIYHRFD